MLSPRPCWTAQEADSWPAPPEQAQEALRRAKFKFAGRQKIVVSRNWGFTKFARADYVAWKKAGRLINDGVNAKVGVRLV